MNPSSVSHGRCAFDGERNRAAEVGLLEKIRAGDVAAFAEWLERSWRPLVLYCARILGNRDGAEDVAQEAFIRIWERRCHWRPQSSLRAILYTIARNLSLNQRSSPVRAGWWRASHERCGADRSRSAWKLPTLSEPCGRRFPCCLPA